MLARSLVCTASLIAALTLPLSSLAASETAPTEIELQTKRIALFKNGFGIVTGQAKLPDQPGAVRITPLPQATLGSFWLNWNKQTQVSQIIARTVETSEDQPARSIPELLRANAGKTVRLKIGDEWLTGKVRPSLPEQAGSTLLLETQDTLVVLNPNQVQRIELPLNAKIQVAQTTTQPVVDLNLDKVGQDASLQVEYMASGIAWSPSYRVDLIDEETAQLTAKAVIVNDLTDLHDVSIELVTGYPHLQYAHQPSSFSPTSLHQFLRDMRRDRSRESGFALGGQALSNTASRRESRTRHSPAQPIEGQSTEDLYFYPLQDITLAKGERGYFPIFEETVPYKHVYTWDIPDAVDNNNRYRRDDRSKPAPEIVWHAIALTNTTKHPWTTAPGQTAKDTRVLGQDTVHYTPAGASTDLRITQALAIKAEQVEFEVDRDPQAQRFHGSTYEKVTIQGELVLTNRKGKAVTVKVSKQMSGEVGSAEGEPKITKLATGLRAVNPRSELQWEVPLPADSTKPVKLTYRYTVHIRR